MDHVLRHAGAWLLWWVAIFWVWFLLVGEWNRIELVAAACAATVTATCAETIRAKAGMRVAIPLRLVPSALKAMAQAFLDFGIVMGVLILGIAHRRVHRGEFVVRDFEGPLGDDPRSFGERAFRIFAANLSPNAYVVDMSTEQRSVLMHDLVVNRKSEEPA